MDELQKIFPELALYLHALALSLPRTLAIFQVFPPFTRLALPQSLKVPVVIAISVPILIQIKAQLHGIPLSPLNIVFLSAKEALIGALIAIVASVPFWIAEMSGEFIDFIRQAPEAEIQNPDNSQQGILASIFAVFFAIYFVSINGFAILIGTIYASYEIWPALSSIPFPDGLKSDKMLLMLDFMMRSALLLAAPIVIFVLLGYLITIIVSKILPQMNVSSMSMAVKNIAFLIAIQIYGLYFISDYTSIIAYVKTALPTVKALLNGG